MHKNDRESDPSPTEVSKPNPTFADVSYGTHERNILDFWTSQSDEPTPLVVHFHGGGFRGGSKANLPSTLLRECLDAGISVAACNYRLSGDAPFPAAMHDSGRAIQFLRSKAGEYNLDAKRVAATGGSAGGGISLWLGFHDDLADPDSDDPIGRESTRLSCMGVINTQSTYDLPVIDKLVGRSPQQTPELLEFYGLTVDEANSTKAQRLYDEASAMKLISAGAPPIFMWYTQPNRPVTEELTLGQRIHHPTFGNVLKQRCEELGIECTIRYGDDYPGETVEEQRRLVDKDIVNFFKRHFATRR